MDPLTLSPQDRDLYIRTIIGETNSSDPSSVGVAQVIANRMRASGQSAKDVVLAPGQFEPWSSRSKELLSISPSDPRYKAAAQIVDNVASGKTPDPTGGANQFYAPAAQSALGRPAPAWDNGQGQQIGAHKFFGGGKQTQSDPFADYGVSSPAPAQASPQPDKVTGSVEEYPAAVKAAPQTAPKAASSPSDPFEDYGVNAAPQTAASAPSTQAVTPAAKLNGSDASNAEIVNSLPLIGPSLYKAGAAIDALTGQTTGGQPITGQTFGDRYTNALNYYDTQRQLLGQQSPTASAAAKIGGGVLGSVPAVMAAPEMFGAGAGGLLGRTALGAASGAGLSGADTAIRGGSPLDVERSALTGGALGLAGPAAGDVVGAGVGALARGMSRTDPALANIANTLHESGLTPLQAEARMAQLGPFGTLADVSPVFQNEAGGLASKGGAPTQILKSAMEARAAGKDTRIADTVAQTVGPRPDLSATRQGIEDSASAAAKPYYDAARASPKPADATPVVSYIDNELASAKGGVAKTLQMARNLVTKPSSLPSVTVPEDSAQGLLGARQALDDFIKRGGDADTTAGQNALRQASIVRGKIDQIVKSDPNIAAGDAAYSTKISERGALDEGAELFKPGTRIEDVQRSVAGKTPEQLSAMQQGALAALHDRLDGVSGDWGAARQMFAKSDANRQKLDALFPGAKDLFDKIEAEAAMRQTETQVAQGSQTAGRRAVQEKYGLKGDNSTAGVLSALTGGATFGGPGAVAGALGGKAFRSALDNMRASANAKLIHGTASALATPYSASSPMMDQLTRAFYNTPKISALSSGASALTNTSVRNSQPLLPAGVFPNGVGASALIQALANRQ